MSKASDYNTIIDTIQATILNGQTESSIVDLKGTTSAVLYIPASFTGTSISFQTSFDNGDTFFVLQDGNGNPVSPSVSPSISVPLSPQQFYGIRLLKIVSGSAEVGDKIITVVPYII